MLVPKLLIDASFNTEKEELFMLGSVILWCLGSLAATGFITCAIMFWLKRNEDKYAEGYTFVASLPVVVVSAGWVSAA